MFTLHVGPSLSIHKIEGMHVTLWIESEANWGPTTGNDAVSTVQRAFNWAVKRGHLQHSPVSHVEGKPRRCRRQIVFNSDEWEEIRGEVKDRALGDLTDAVDIKQLNVSKCSHHCCVVALCPPIH